MVTESFARGKSNIGRWLTRVEGEAKKTAKAILLLTGETNAHMKSNFGGLGWTGEKNGLRARKIAEEKKKKKKGWLLSFISKFHCECQRGKKEKSTNSTKKRLNRKKRPLKNAKGAREFGGGKKCKKIKFSPMGRQPKPTRSGGSNGGIGGKGGTLGGEKNESGGFGPPVILKDSIRTKKRERSGKKRRWRKRKSKTVL